MGAHRRKWGWWLVAALAVVLVASLFLKSRRDTPSGSASSVPADSAGTAPVVRDTVYVDVDGERVPVIRERKVEAGEDPGKAVGAAETVISVPVKDITSLIRAKGGKGVSVSTQAPDRISVAYSGKVDVPVLGGQDMNLAADFRIVEVKGNRLVLQLDSGTAMNVVADLFSSTIMDYFPDGLVESFSGGRAVVNLSAVPQLRKRLDGIDLVGFSVDGEGLKLRTVPK